MPRNKDSVDIFVVPSIINIIASNTPMMKMNIFLNKLVSYRIIVEVVKKFFFLTRRIKVHCK